MTLQTAIWILLCVPIVAFCCSAQMIITLGPTHQKITDAFVNGTLSKRHAIGAGIISGLVVAGCLFVTVVLCWFIPEASMYGYLPLIVLIFAPISGAMYLARLTS